MKISCTFFFFGVGGGGGIFSHECQSHNKGQTEHVVESVIENLAFPVFVTHIMGLFVMDLKFFLEHKQAIT